MNSLLGRQDLAAAVARLRGDASVAACAERAGLSQRAWRGYEAGHSNPQPERFVRLARGLRVAPVKLQRAVVTAWADRVGEHSSLERTTGNVVLVVLGGAAVVQPVAVGSSWE